VTDDESGPRSPRVLHLINGEYFGGTARVLVNYLGAGARRADVCVAVHFEGELLHRLQALGIPTELVRMRGRLDLTAAREVARLARRVGADIVHTHQLRNTLLARLASFAGGPPVVTHVHSPAFRESTHAWRNAATGAVDRALALRTRRFIAVSNSLAAELRRLGIGAERVRVVHNGIPLPAPASRAAGDALHAELGVAAGVPVVGMVAVFRPRKGAELLIQAAARVLNREVPMHLLMVGEAFREEGRDYGAELRAMADRAGLGANVTFTGFTRDVERIIAGLDLFVLPSRFGEGLPMVLLEAMGAGVPVITTPVEGIAEMVTDGENGVLVPVDDPDALETAMVRALADAPARQRLGAAGRRTVVEGYTSDAMARGIESVYREIVAW
jgi:glycosyltransferase involved in cell wall biosynthesis